MKINVSEFIHSITKGHQSPETKATNIPKVNTFILWIVMIIWSQKP